MSLARLLLCLGCLFATLSGASAAGPVAGAPDRQAKSKTATAGKQFNCWKIEQDNFIFGECTIYACPQALKVVFKNGKWINLAKAPDWELYVFNPSAKVYYHCPLDKWRANSFQMGMINAAGGKPVRSGRTLHIAGQMSEELVIMGQGPGEITASYWLARDLKFPEAVYHVLCGNALLPQLHAVPMRVITKTAYTPKTVDTRTCRQVDMDASFFDMPRGYTLSAKPEDVMSTGVMDVVKDMAGY